MPDAGRLQAWIFHSPNGLRLDMPGGWVHRDDEKLVQNNPALLVAAHADARAAGYDVGLRAQAATASHPPPKAEQVAPGFRFDSFDDAIANARSPEWIVRGVLE